MYINQPFPNLAICHILIIRYNEAKYSFCKRDMTFSNVSRKHLIRGISDITLILVNASFEAIFEETRFY